ncbi:MAG: MAPEG family protein [Sphingomonas sp.]|uniref:MAPEG family protein n=1 Tax=Sphingomonas sp. TaxID=28214 RepID=UPI001ACE7A59|nr:MAPEG family protein [Sphingomonas sp.]MBN8809222.1 MAPEG family protein [Sphingomonas sp.]
MILPVTLAIAAAVALINLWLALRVTRVRVYGKHMLGDGADPAVIAKMRAHANFTEYAPTIVILIALIELARGPSLWLWLVGAAFIVARLAHAIGMDRPAPNPFRLVGALVTWLALLALAVWALAIGYQASADKPVPAERTIYLGNPKG